MLKDTQIKALKPKDKTYLVADGDSLYVVVNTNGSKKWRYRYRINGKAKTLSLGSYPEIKPAAARERLREAREQVALGVDPSSIKKEEKVQQKLHDNRKAFKDVSAAYLKSIEGVVSSHHHERSESLIRLYANPVLGERAIADITHKDVKQLIVNLSEVMNKKASAKKLFGVLKLVFAYAERFDDVEMNVVKLLTLGDLVTGHVVKKQATITKPKEIKLLMKNIHNYEGHFNTIKAMEFMLHTALRSANIRQLKWKYIKGDIITIPKEEMKIAWDKVSEATDFKLPLSTQAKAILKEMKPVSGHGTYVFPSLRGDRPMSENALLAMVRGMGYSKDQFTPHGARAMFSTVANEVGEFNTELIDVQLAHKVGGTVSQAYNRAEYIDKRRKLSQWWSDWLEAL